MKTQLRLFCVALLAPVLALAVLAQEAPPAEEPPVLPAKTYDLSGLIEDGALNKIPDVLAPDRTFYDVMDPTEEGDWAVRHCRGGSRCFSSADEAISAILAFCNTGLEASYTRDSANPGAFTLTCDETLHQRVQWALDTLKATSAVRVHLRAYAPAAGAGGGTLSKAEAAQLAQGARLIGSVEGRLGETLLLQQVKPHEFVQGYNTTEGGAATERAMICAGQELVTGALLLPDGRLWLQGWAAQLENVTSREVATRCGKLECPRGNYAYATLGALIENNGGAMLELGAQRVLVICSVDGAMPNRTLECGTRTTLGMVNVAAAVVAHSPAMPWLCAPATGPTRLGRAANPEESWPQSNVASYAAVSLATRLAYEGEVLGAVVALGPYLGVRITENEGDCDIEEFQRARTSVATLLKALNAGPMAAEINIRAWRVKNVSEELAAGAAGIKELSALGAPVFERTSAGLPGQFNYAADIEAAALVVGDSGVPEVGVACWGSQCAWRMLAGALGPEFELRLGHVEGERTIKLGLGGKAEFERAGRLPAQAELSGPLGEGALRYAVVPASDGYLVVAVRRIK
jgi:hypothetical protein